MGVGGEEGEDSCGVESGGGVREEDDDEDDGGSAIVQGILPQFWFTEGRDRQRPPWRFCSRRHSEGSPR